MATEGQIVEVSLISKMSLKTLKTSPAKHASESGTPIAVIFGMASGIKEVVDKVRGDVYHALTGEFEAQNIETGERFRSGVLYLPAGIHEMIEAPVKKLESESDYVAFALQMLAVKSSNPAGYSYQARNLMPSKQVDPLEELRSQLSGGIPSPQLTAGATGNQTPAKSAPAKSAKKR